MFCLPDQLSFCSDLKVLRKEEENPALSFSEIGAELSLQWMFIWGLVGSRCLLALLFPTLFSCVELGEKKWAVWLNSICSHACLPPEPHLPHLWMTFDDTKDSKVNISRICVCVHTYARACTHTHLYLSIHPGKLEEIDLLNFPFDLCLPVAPLLQ